jgi:hypothetical protein
MSPINMTFKRFFLSTFLMGFLAACSGAENWLATPTPISVTETPLPTATIVWFPPSATPTPQALSTKAPTPEMRPGLGDILLEDDFSDPSLWNVAASNQASAAVENNRLTIAVQSGVSMLSLRQDLFPNNYYAEVTARPSLCRGDDNYGVLVRASAASFYRFVLACNGTIRAERVLNGTRIVIQEPVPSADVPPGAPGEVRIGIWAFDRDIRIFLNGRYQFSISEPTLASGTIGFYVRSAGSTATVVSFSDLVVQEVYK